VYLRRGRRAASRAMAASSRRFGCTWTRAAWDDAPVEAHTW